MTDQPDIDDLLLDWEDSVAQGHELSPEELCRDRPELLDELKRRIQALRAMRWMEKPSDDDAPAPLAASQPVISGAVTGWKSGSAKAVSAKSGRRSTRICSGWWRLR